MTLAPSTYSEYIAISTIGICVFALIMRTIDGGYSSTISERNIGKQLVDQAKYWYSISMQDRKPIIAYEHSIYAIAYLNAARHVTHDAILEQHSGMNIHSLLKNAIAHQQQCIKEINKQYPKIKLKNSQTTWL